MTPKDDPKRWLRGTCQQSLLGTQSHTTADKGPEVAESDERNGSTTQSPTPRREQPINVH